MSEVRRLTPMSKYQWLLTLAWLTARWPKAAELPESTLEAWYEDLSRYPHSIVQEKLEKLYTDGLPWDPGRIGTELMARLKEWSAGSLGREYWEQGQRLDRPALPADEEAERKIRELYEKHGSWAEAFRALVGERDEETGA